MTNSELKHKIAEAADIEWYKNVKETFNFHYVDFVQQITGVSAIYEFVNQQISGWDKYSDSLPGEFKQSKTYFVNIKNQIIQFVNSYNNQTGNNLNSYWQNVRNQINNLNSKPLPYNVPQTEFLLKVYKETPNYYQGAYHFVLGTNNYNVNNRDNLYGALLAYEFTLKDHTQIVERRKVEQNSISKIRSDFQKYLNESETELLEHLKKSNNSYQEYVKKIDDLVSEKNIAFNDWFENTKNEEWQKWYQPSVKKIAELEETYKEKLKLEEPAKFWSERALKLKKQGWISVAIIVALVLIVSWSLGEILWKTPEQLYSSWFGDDKSAAIRWSIVYVTLISFIAYCIRALTKVMFSSFHLARDCEERYTLTYFYLSLLKDSKVDEKDRQLIMQSLFSRAETGLLKDDSSPTMPSDAISKIITK
jgi:hypothetical protein